MKFLIGLMTVILITGGIASAQHGNTPPGHVNLGIKGGLNYFNVHNDDGTKYDSRFGYHFGLLGHIHFDNHFYFFNQNAFFIIHQFQFNFFKINVQLIQLLS